MKVIHSEKLKTTGTDWTDKAMTTGTGTYYSDPLPVRRSNGYAALLVKSSSGSLAITQEVSIDGLNWYTPYDTDGNDLGVIASALTVTTGKWIVFNPQIGNYMRIKAVLTGANSTVSMTYIQQEGE